MNCSDRYLEIKKTIPENVTLLAVSKTWPKEDILEVYNVGCRDFGENKVQEMTHKSAELPADIRWHQIGHLQTNKIKYMIPYVYMIHSIDSVKLLAEVNKQAAKHDRVVKCLLQVKVASEETKFGFSIEELKSLLEENAFAGFPNVQICGLMGMATNTDDEVEIRKEFLEVSTLLRYIRDNYIDQVGEGFSQISMGMSGDYPLAIECGSTIVRVGSTIFGERDYSK